MRKLILPFFALLSMVAYAQPAQKLPPHSTIIYFGDSQTSYAFASNGNAVQYQNYGYAAWVNALTPGAQIPRGGVLGVPGETTAEMLNRLGAIQTFAPKLMVVLAGTNDPLYGIGPEATKTNLRKIYNAGIAAGAKVIAITILPRFGPNAYSTGNETARLSINEWIKAQTDVLVVNAEADMFNPALYEDGLHPSPTGCYILGNKVAAVVNQQVAQCISGSAPASDLTVAGNTNPYLTGSNGSRNTASGTVANNWELAGNSAGGALVSGAKETDLSGREHQLITISGTYTGGWSQATFNNYTSAPALTSGQVVEGVAEVEVLAQLVNVRAIFAKIIVYNKAWNIVAESNSMFPTSANEVTMPPGKYLLRTPPAAIPNDVLGFVTTQVVVLFNNAAVSQPVSAALKISSAGVRNLPLSAGPLAAVSPSGIVPLCPGNTMVLQAGTGAGYSYQWHMNDAEITGATASSFTASTSGSYTVKVAAQGCAVKSEPTVVRVGDCPPHLINTSPLPASLCSGQSLQVPYTSSGFFDAGNTFTAQLSDANGSFAAPLTIGSIAATGSGTIEALVPASLPHGAGYRIRVVSSSPAVTGTDNGAAIGIGTQPVLTSTLTPPALCNNGLFAYTPSATPEGTAFAWSRASVAGIANAASSGNGSISETLRNTTTAPVNVVYVYTLTNNGCAGSLPYQVVLQVNPSPVVTTKNSSVILNAAGKAVITPAQVDNGSVGYCGPLQYTLDKTQFTCSNIGVNTVTLRITDANGNTGSATATVTVADASGPSITNASASPTVLWPANGKMINVTVGYTAADNCSAATVSLSVKSNEAESGLFKGDKGNDWKIVNNRQVQLKAERDPSGTGRIYTITITATDAKGNRSTQDVLVTVPVSAGSRMAAEASSLQAAVLPSMEQGLHLSATPNPAAGPFVLVVKSNRNLPVTIKTIDVAGRVVETKRNAPANGSLSVGQSYLPGLYIVEAVQGEERVLLRVIKTRQ